jgi:hypothetical protein
MATKPAADDAQRPRILSRSTVLPAAGIGLITAVLAAQEHAPLAVAAVVGVAIALVVIGMIAFKRIYRRD